MDEDFGYLEVVDKWLIALGELLLTRYKHPDDWVAGHELGIPHLKYHRVLMVRELQAFEETDKRAAKTDLFARSLEAWFASRQHQAKVFQIHRLQDQPGLVAVNIADWGTALSCLRPIDRIRRAREAELAGAAPR